MKLAYTLFFVCIIFSKLSYAESIVVVNIQFLIDNNKDYLNILEEMELSQKDHLDIFQKRGLKKYLRYRRVKINTE